MHKNRLPFKSHILIIISVIPSTLDMTFDRIRGYIPRGYIPRGVVVYDVL